MVECWKPVYGYEDLYQVSDMGRVRRIAAGRGTHVGRILRLCNDRYGYAYVILSRNNHHKHQKVHRLVVEAFLGPCPAGLQVNHRNGIKDDNRIGNLEYATPRANVRYSFDVLGRKALHGEAKSQAKLTDAIVREIRRLHANGVRTQCELAERYGISRGHIGRILRRERWAHVA